MMSKKLDRLQNNNPLQRPGGQIDNRQLNKMFDGIIPQIEGSALGQTLQISRYENGAVDELRFGKVEMNRIGLVFTSRYTLDDWCDAGHLLDTLQSALNWWLGDWLAACDPAWRDDGLRFISQQTGFNYESLRQYERVCKAVPHNHRHPALSYSHHLQVSHIDDAVRAEHLQHAAIEGLSVRQFKDYLAKLTERSESPFKRALVDFQFGDRRKEMRSIERKLDAAIGGDRKAWQEVRGWIDATRLWLDEIDSALG